MNYGEKMSNNYLPPTPKRIKDMDRRPEPIHIDDFNGSEDPDQKWVPGSKKTVKKSTKPGKPKKDNTESIQNAVSGSFEIIHRLFILIIALAVIGGIIVLAIWISQVYGLDLGGEFSKIPEMIFGKESSD
jgi:hypothetical protein